MLRAMLRGAVATALLVGAAGRLGASGAHGEAVGAKPWRGRKFRVVQGGLRVWNDGELGMALEEGDVVEAAGAPVDVVGREMLPILPHGVVQYSLRHLKELDEARKPSGISPGSKKIRKLRRTPRPWSDRKFKVASGVGLPYVYTSPSKWTTTRKLKAGDEVVAAGRPVWAPSPKSRGDIETGYWMLPIKPTTKPTKGGGRSRKRRGRPAKRPIKSDGAVQLDRLEELGDFGDKVVFVKPATTVHPVRTDEPVHHGDVTQLSPMFDRKRWRIGLLHGALRSSEQAVQALDENAPRQACEALQWADFQLRWAMGPGGDRTTEPQPPRSRGPDMPEAAEWAAIDATESLRAASASFSQGQGVGAFVTDVRLKLSLDNAMDSLLMATNWLSCKKERTRLTHHQLTNHLSMVYLDSSH